MNIRFLETFIWLVRLKSFSKVAEKLNTTQPNVSGRISTLEDLLNVKLYVKGVKSFELTAAGRKLLSYAEKLVEISSDMVADVGNVNEQSGVIRVGIVEMVTVTWLPEYIKRLKAELPNIAIDFSTETSHELIKAVRKDELDLVFVYGPVNEPLVVNRFMCDLEISWYANPEYFDCKNELDVIELSKLPIITSRKNASGYSIVRDYFKSYGVEILPTTEAGIQLNCAYSSITAAELVVKGLGIMAMPNFLMKDKVKSGHVAPLNIRQSLPSIYITACYKEPIAQPNIKKMILLAKAVAQEFSDFEVQ